MKKFFCILTSAILLLSMAACSNAANVAHVRREVGKSEQYSEAEINAAMDVVIDHFKKHFDSCTLYLICYDEESVQEEEQEWAETYEADEAIVLVSHFTTGKNSGSFEPYSIYTDWQWVLVRNEGKDWTLKSWGYA